MRKLFSYDNFLFHVLSQIADCMCLSLLWVIGSIPIVTMGASTTALYYAVNKCVKNSQGGILREFWRSYRLNFKQATVIWLMVAPVLFVLAVSCYSAYLMHVSGRASKLLLIFLLVVASLVIMWANYLFPYLARFNNKSKQILINCIWISLFDIIKSFANFALLAIAVLAVLTIPLCLGLVPAVYMLFTCYIQEPIFRKYMSPEDRSRELGESEEYVES